MDDANQQAHDNTMALLGELCDGDRAAHFDGAYRRQTIIPAPLDQATLDAAEKVVLDRIPRTLWAAEARLLKLVAADIRKLGDS